MIAIIAILAGMLLPALGKARERARAATCVSNMKQCYNLHVLYADDNDGYLIPNNDQNPAYSTWALPWPSHLGKEGYVEAICSNWNDWTNSRDAKTTAKFLSCPAGPNPTNADGTRFIRYSFGSKTRASEYQSKSDGRSIVRMSKPRIASVRTYWSDDLSSFMLLTDSIRASGSSLIGTQYCVGDGTSAYWAVHLRHSKRANVLMMDGHVESADLNKFKEINNGIYAISGQLVAHKDCGHIYDDTLTF